MCVFLFYKSFMFMGFAFSERGCDLVVLQKLYLLWIRFLSYISQQMSFVLGLWGRAGLALAFG